MGPTDVFISLFYLKRSRWMPCSFRPVTEFIYACNDGLTGPLPSQQVVRACDH
ncbi:Uncharacterised protein [Vibrio cholerae]|nr:Uncharacterised protein [Vibrio cholerae]CSI72886.1 Uncharacterised protein [Vibrio cholerae]